MRRDHLPGCVMHASVDDGVKKGVEWWGEVGVLSCVRMASLTRSNQYPPNS